MTKQTQHTPGPWELHGLTIIDKDGKHIADFGLKEFSDNESLANARLCLAALYNFRDSNAIAINEIDTPLSNIEKQAVINAINQGE